MPPLTLVQKRALIAAANNVNKKERAFGRAEAIPRYWRTQEQNKTYSATARQWRDARAILAKLEKKLGINGTTVNYHLMSQNVIANVLKKHKFAEPLIARAKATMWRKGLEAEMERARANFRNFEKGVFHQKINLIGESHRKKTPSPPKRASPRRTSPPPANNAHRRIHGIGPANNTRITWSRNANGKVLIYQTLSKLQLRLTNAQRNALSKMSETQAMNTIRQLARQR